MSVPRGVREFLLPGRARPVPWVTVADPAGNRRVPTFVGVDGGVRVRVRTRLAGDYEISDDGEIIAHWRVDHPEAPVGPLLRASGRHLVDQSGDPFLWLADTWWFALCDRVSEGELAELAGRRIDQGYNVVQIVAGLLPEVDAYEDLGELDGVWPWTPDFTDVEPRWWAAAERRLDLIIEAGLTPAVVGAWSYYLLDMGAERMLRHWREVIARWSAYPIVWCVAGEAGLPHYHQLDEPGLDAVVGDLSTGWRAITAEVSRMDGYQNLRTVHPCPAFAHFSSTDAIGDADDLDLVWLQTGHADRSSIPDSLAALDRELAAPHGLPVINSEVCYEGIAAGSSATLQRFLFFSPPAVRGRGAHVRRPGPVGLPPCAGPRAGDHVGRRDVAGSVRAAGVGTAGSVRRFPPRARLGATGTRAGRAVGACRPRPPGPSLRRPVGAEVIAYFPAVSLLPADRGISQALRDVSFLGLEPGRWRVDYWNPRRGEDPLGFDAEVGADGRLPAATRHPPIRRAEHEGLGGHGVAPLTALLPREAGMVGT